MQTCMLIAIIYIKHCELTGITKRDLFSQSCEYIDDPLKSISQSLSQNSKDLDIQKKIKPELKNCLKCPNIIPNLTEFSNFNHNGNNTKNSMVKQRAVKYKKNHYSFDKPQINVLIAVYLKGIDISDAFEEYRRENQIEEIKIKNESIDQNAPECFKIKDLLKEIIATSPEPIPSYENCEVSTIYSESSKNDFDLENHDLDELYSEEITNITLILNQNCKKLCKNGGIIPIKQALDVNNFNRGEFPKLIYVCTFIQKYGVLISYIECLITEYVNKKYPQSYFKINDVLYDAEIYAIEGFSTTKFVPNCYDCFQKPAIISNIADMLECFFNDSNINDKYKFLIFFFKSSGLKNEDDLNDFLQCEIITFLNSEESVYLKSFCPEFISFEKNVQNFKKTDEKNYLKSFIVFLLLIKRNYKIIPNFIESISNLTDENIIIEKFNDEICNSLSFVYVFIVFLPFNEFENVFKNISSIIMVYCALLEDEIYSIQNDYFNIIFILEYLFFELKEHLIFENVIYILNFKDEELIFDQNILKVMQKVKLHIYILIQYLQHDFSVKICELNISENQKFKIRGEIDNLKKNSLKKYKKLLNTFNRFIHYQIYFKVNFLSKYLQYFMRKGK